METRKSLVRALVALASAFVLAAVAVAQNAATKSGQPETRPQTLFQKLEAANASGGIAPKRDLGGSWTGPLTATYGEMPPLTPAGQARFKLNKPDPFSATSNDPWRKCDPLGFPRSATTETRGVSFATMPDRIVIMTQFQRVWRQVWMDGRELPKNIGGRNGPDLRWYGYSVGHWDGDYTLVVNTAGMLDQTWLDRRGYPHSSDLRVEERYTRPSHDVLDLTLTVDDPKTYTKPFVLATNRFRWVPDQDEEEQLCVPSEAEEYLKLIVIPADQDKATGKK